MKRIVTIFGSSRPLPGSPEYKNAVETGRLLARAGFSVCNGGYGGTMEAASRGAFEEGGHTIGVTTDFFSRTPNQWIREQIRTTTLIERLLKLVELGNAYAILRGGTGTLLELAAVWEFVNKGVIGSKPIIVIGEFWSPVVRTIAQELKKEGAPESVHEAANPSEAVSLLKGLLAV